jgi:hypothetical protein
MGEHETDWVALAGWAVSSAWAVGFSASVAPSGLAVLGAAIVSSAGAAAIVPDIWRRGRTALLGAATLVLPWALNAHTASAPSAKAVTLGVLAVVLAVWAAAADPSWISRSGRRK